MKVLEILHCTCSWVDIQAAIVPNSLQQSQQTSCLHAIAVMFAPVCAEVLGDPKQPANVDWSNLDKWASEAVRIHQSRLSDSHRQPIAGIRYATTLQSYQTEPDCNGGHSKMCMPTVVAVSACPVDAHVSPQGLALWFSIAAVKVC